MNKLNKNLIFILFALAVVNVGYAQKNQVIRANKKFDKYSFIDAREIYLNAFQSGYKSPQIFERLGDTYFFNSQYVEAANWYGRLIKQYPEKAKPIYYYRAAQTLKSIGEYDKSDQLMKIYLDTRDSEQVVKNFVNHPDYLDKIKNTNNEFYLNKVTLNTGGSKFGPSYYQDKLVFASAVSNSETEKLYNWNKQPYLDLFIANVDDSGDLFNPSRLKGEINSPYHEASATFTKDGKTVYFTRNNYINGKIGEHKESSINTVRLKLYKATRNEDSWGDIVELPFNSDQYSTGHPTLSLDEKKLYFSSDRKGSIGMSDLWYVEINEDGSYSTPINMGSSINTEARESFPFISQENNLYFASDGHAGIGGYDTYVTPLDSIGANGIISHLGVPINSPFDDFGFIIKERMGVGYLSSNRDGNGGSANDNIFIVNKNCSNLISGNVINDLDGEKIPNAEVLLLDNNNNVIESTKADIHGRFAFTKTVSCSSRYKVRGKSDKCEYNEVLLDSPKSPSKLEVNLFLSCNDCLLNDLGCRLDLQPIYFAYNKYDIRPEAEVELSKILAAMRAYPNLKIKIESHTDSRGDDKYNEKLSENRAKSTLQWLVDQGVNLNRLSAEGYGEYQLLNKCSNYVECNEEEHLLNRRSVFYIQD